MNSNEKNYKNLDEFYPFYLSQHLNPICRFLHVFGTLLGVIVATSFVLHGQPWFFPVGFIFGYGFSWIGHFIFEKNRPATFKYPLLSFCCDFLMIKDFFMGQLERKISLVKSGSTNLN